MAFSFFDIRRLGFARFPLLATAGRGRAGFGRRWPAWRTYVGRRWPTVGRRWPAWRISVGRRCVVVGRRWPFSSSPSTPTLLAEIAHTHNTHAQAGAPARSQTVPCQPTHIGGAKDVRMAAAGRPTAASVPARRRLDRRQQGYYSCYLFLASVPGCCRLLHSSRASVCVCSCMLYVDPISRFGVFVCWTSAWI